MQVASQRIGFAAIRCPRGLFPCPRPETWSRQPTVSRKSVPFRVIQPFGDSSSEFLRLQHRSPVFRRELYLPGVSALFTTSLTGVHVRKDIPSPRFVPSSGALSLSTFFSAHELAGLFHPAAVFRTHPVQGLILSAQPYFLVESLLCPLVVVAASLIGRPVSTKTAPRLRGFAPREGA